VLPWGPGAAEAPARFALGADGTPVAGAVVWAFDADTGAYVDGATWDRVLAAGLDPDAALARADSGTALYAADALFVSGPTGINHADLVIVG